MTKGTFKKFAALLVAGTMVIGSTVTAFAGDGVADGEGSYEGGEMKYPVLSVTLPTIPTGAYNYIADPNGLIKATAAAAYEEAEFTGETGIFFKTTDADVDGEDATTYTNKSRALTLKNKNAQDIDVTIKLEEKTAGDDTIEYADSATFEEGDTAQKLFLAVTDDAASDARISALGESAATLTTKVAGNPDNYKPNWDETNGYGYVLDETKKDGEDYTWNYCSYILTGALNKAATWGDEVDFPTITVTWSFKEHVDSAAPSVASNTATMALGEDTEIEFNLGIGDEAATGIASITYTASDKEYAFAASDYSVSGTTLTLSHVKTDKFLNAGVETRVITITFDDEAATKATVTLSKAEG